MEESTPGEGVPQLMAVLSFLVPSKVSATGTGTKVSTIEEVMLTLGDTDFYFLVVLSVGETRGAETLTLTHVFHEHVMINQ